MILIPVRPQYFAAIVWRENDGTMISKTASRM